MTEYGERIKAVQVLRRIGWVVIFFVALVALLCLMQVSIPVGDGRFRTTFSPDSLACSARYVKYGPTANFERGWASGELGCTMTGFAAAGETWFRLATPCWITAICFVLALWKLVAVARRFASRSRHSAGRCQNCGYSLT